MGLSPNTISVAIVAFRPESLQNFSAYIPYKPQNLFSDSVTKFYDFTGESAFGDRPIMRNRSVRGVFYGLKETLYNKSNYFLLNFMTSSHYFFKRMCFVFFVMTLLFSFVDLHATYAVAFDPNTSIKKILVDEAKLGTLTPDVVVLRIVQLVLTLVGLIAVVMILWGGFMWLFSAGSSERLRHARDILVAAITGLAIIMAAYGIVSYVFNELNKATGATTFIQRIYRS